MNPQPNDSDRGEITDTADATGVTLSWPAYKAGAGSVAKWVLLLWIGGWAVGWLGAAREIAVGAKNPLMYVWFAAWTVGGVVALIALRRTLLPPTPESVRLEADALRYDPGRGPSESRSCAELPSGKVVPVNPAPAMKVPKSAVRGFGVDRVNERQRLYVDLEDERRVEIGGCLTESERAWLFAVLQQWLGAPRATAPWAREARRTKEAQA